MILNSPTISGSLTVTGNTVLSGSINVVGGLTGTASFASTAISSSYSATATSSSYALASTSASYALASTTASYGLNALTSSNSMTASSADTLYVRNNATVLGSITAQTLVVQTVTSSILITTGSNKIGSSLSNVQELTGSVGITGSLAVNGAATVSTTLSISDDFTLASTNPQIKWNAGNLRFTSLTAGNVMVTVNETGSVGIGTTAPQATLDVRGKYYAIANIADNIVEVINSDSTNGYGLYVRAGGTATNRYVARFKNGADTDVMWLDKGGNVGIGTTSPNHLLTLSATASNKTEIGLYNTFNDASNRNWVIATNQTAFADFHLIQSNAQNGNPASSGTTRLMINASGNVGIGTTSPLQKFHVYNSSSSTVAIFQGPTNSYIQLGTSSESYIGNVGGALTFEAGGSERMRITSSGSFQMPWTNNMVSIMNYDDSYRMGFLYQANARTLTLFSAGGDSKGEIAFYTRGTAGSSSTDYGTERMRITNTGRVGIGINSPETTLDVSGTTRITGGGRFYMNNSIMMGYVLQHGDLANGDGSNTTATDTKATNGTAKKRASGASSNTFFYGPYHTLPAGNYVAGFRMKVANNSSSSRIVSIDVSNVVAVSGASALAPNNFASSDTYQYFKIYFTVADPTAQIEFRGLSFVTGITDIFLDHILVMPNLMV